MATPTYDVGVIKRHPYVAAFGTTVIAPLAEAPVITMESTLRESLVYENGGSEAVASLLTGHSVTITLNTKNIATALSLVGDFIRGEDVMSSAHRKSLTFTAVTPSGVSEPSLVFPSAWLQPELSYVPTMGGDHTARLVFRALPDADGNLYTFA